jgi:hypothetical protein
MTAKPNLTIGPLMKGALAILAAGAISTAAADEPNNAAARDITAAFDRLSKAENHTFSLTTRDGHEEAEQALSGRTERSGWTCLRLKKGPNWHEFAFNGTRGVVAAGAEWVTLEELKSAEFRSKLPAELSNKLTRTVMTALAAYKSPSEQAEYFAAKVAQPITGPPPSDGLMTPEGLVFLGFPLLILWIYALFSAINNERLDSEARMVWVALIVMSPALGVTAYLLGAPDRPNPGAPVVVPRSDARSLPVRLARWALLCCSAAPLLIGMHLIGSESGGDAKSAGVALLIAVFIPISLSFSFPLAVVAILTWRISSALDRVLGLIPLLFPVVVIALLCI